MIAFFKGKAVQQVDSFLCESGYYSSKDIEKIIREHRIVPINRARKSRGGKR